MILTFETAAVLQKLSRLLLFLALSRIHNSLDFSLNLRLAHARQFIYIGFNFVV